MPRTPEEARLHYIANKQLILERNRKWKEDNWERWMFIVRRWRKNNRERRSLQSKSAYRRNKAKRTAQNLLWRRANPDKAARYAKRWAVKHPGKIAFYSAQRRQRVNKTPPVIAIKADAVIDSIKSKKTFKCYYCGKRFGSALLHIEHVVPLIQNGGHSVDNIAASCKTCNLQKGGKTISNWKRTGQQILQL